MSEAVLEGRKPAAAEAPMRPLRMGPREVAMRTAPDGTIYVKSAHPLGPYGRRYLEPLEHWAGVAPDRVFLAERDAAGEWRRLTYAAALAEVRAVGEALLRRKVSVERPVAILSGNSIDHAVLGLAAGLVGVPYAPVSPAYSLVATDYAKLRHIVGLLTPGLIYAADGARFAKAIAAVAPADAEIVVGQNPPPDRPATLFADLLATPPTAAVDRAAAAVTPETILKVLFTSGSTSMPKGAIQTNGMQCANQEMIRTAMAFLRDEPPVLVDWSPWHHTAGGNNNFGLVLFNGGSNYIDGGAPTPALIETMVRNLRDVPATMNSGVPRGWEDLLPYLRADETFRRTFFSRLRLMFYGGASLPQHVWDAYNELAVATVGERIPIMTGFGSTETGPFALGSDPSAPRAGIIGLPPPGLELKLVPNDGKLEARVRGPAITPGYWRQPELTEAAFDEEGFYRLGDAFAFVDPADVSKGFAFDGRVAENFKLTTGTWVSVGPLRERILAHFAPLLRDVVVAGHDRTEIAVLAFPNPVGIAKMAPELGPEASGAAVAAHPAVRAALAEKLASFAAASTGSSNRVARLILLEEPPSSEGGEITDKGSINQRAVLGRRAALVAALYADPPGAEVIVA
ncbi:MAG TPA: feruloyl-CoA synthase [Hyphomicrobiales bacterium]|nr:feruloyl-CoA synthase [Hyphomicrobiales bacterium]